MAGNEPTHLRVILVDCDREAAMADARGLEEWVDGWSVTVEHTADGAFEQVAAGAADCVLCRLRLPETTGIELHERLAVHGHDVPFVLFAAGHSADVTDRVLSSTVDDYVPRRPGEEGYRLLGRRVENAVDAHRTSLRWTEGEQRYRQLFEQVPDPVAVVQGGEFVYLNESCVELFDAGDPGALVGTSVLEFIPEAEREAVERRFRRLQAGDAEKVPHVERGIVTLAGERKYIEVTSGRIPHEGEPAILITARDVTRRKEREQRLTWYETMVETVGDIVYTLDDDYHFTAVTGAAEEVTGYTCDELEDAHLSLLLSEADIQRGLDLRRKVIDGEVETASIEVDIRTKDGGTVPVEFRYRRLPFDDFRGTAGVVRDVSERRARERELQRQNERLDQFASVLSHDLRNPLNVAQGNLDLARETGDEEALERVATAHDRMERIVEDVLTLAREGETVTDLRPVGLAGMAEAAWETVDAREGRLRVETGRSIVADPGRLQQLLENLFHNAVEHGSPSPREAGDAAGRETSDEPSVADAPEDAGVTVTVTVGTFEEGFYVADDGPGIPADERDRVFEWGHSSADEGTGFGLSIVEEVAAAHDWAASVTESEAGGARFEITGVAFTREDG